MEENIQADWERFLDPNELRPNLILASLYIAAYEILKNSIVERIQDFYTNNYDAENGWKVEPEYTQQVLSKDRSNTYASLRWLLESQAINEEDIAKFNKIKACRNLLAHEITKFLAKGLPPEYPGCFNDMVTLLNKIEKWWIVNVEIPTNPDFDGKADEIDESGIVPGPIMSLRMMVDVALGSDEIASYYINGFRKNKSGG